MLVTNALKVLQILGDSKFGGASYLILSWCRYLLDRGCEVTLLSTNQETLARARMIDGLEIIESIYIPRNVILLEDIKALLQLLKLINQQDYDVVHSHTSAPGFIGRMAAWLSRTQVRIHTAHGWPVTDESGWKARLVFTPLEYLAGMMATSIIGVSHATTRQGNCYKLAPRRKLVTICNGIDPKIYITPRKESHKNSLRCRLGIGAECMIIGNVGRLAPQKDNSSLLQALVFLKGLLPSRSFLLILAGDGPEKGDIENLSHSLGVSEEVRFLGFTRNIPDFLTALDVFVSPSLWEGLSISIMEAMASALPIVATNIASNAELIEHEISGLLVPPKSPAEIAKAIARFDYEPDLAQRCSEGAKLKVLGKYTIDRMCQETWDLYISQLEDS